MTVHGVAAPVALICAGVLFGGCVPRASPQAPDGGQSDAGPALTSDGGLDVELHITTNHFVDAGTLLAQGHVFSGTVWFPLTSARAVAPHVFEKGHGLGALRYSLQRFYDAPNVSEAQFTATLEAALAANPDLPFLEQYLGHGGRVLFNFMATPAFLQDGSTPAPAVCGSGPNAGQKQWRPPSDFDAYAKKVVAPTVAFFTKRFGPGQWYEVWNEPTTCTWWGTTEQFSALYAATVKGVRLADPTARIGGPSHSETVWSIGTEGDPPGVSTPFVKAILDAAGRASLPFDFVTLHAYNVNPSANFPFHESELATLRGWLAAAGYPASTPVINDEWNYSVYEDLSADNVNTSFVAAAHAGATMLAYDAAGYDDQATQTFQDLGEAPFTVVGHAFGSARGLPRASYRVFEWLSWLRGPRVEAQSSSPWVRVAATDTPQRLEVFAAGFTPHEQLSFLTALANFVNDFPGAKTSLEPVQTELFAYLAGPSGASMPSSVAAKLTDPEKQGLLAAKALFDHERAVRTDWGVGPGRTDPVHAPGRPLQWVFVIDGLAASPAKVVRRTISSRHALRQEGLANLYSELTVASVPLACAGAHHLQATLGSTATCQALTAYCDSSGHETSGLGQTPDCTVFESFAVEFATYARMTHTQALLTSGQASPEIQRAFAAEFDAAFAQYQPLYDALYERAETRGLEEDVTEQSSFDGGVLRVPAPAEPFSVVELEISKR